MRYLILLLLFPAAASAQDEALEPISTRTGVFTVTQAEKGQELFVVVCGECHQPEDFLEGFLEGWAGQTVDVLFKELRATMPEDSPGSLRSSEYAAVIAFLLQLNGLEAGEENLPASTRRMKEILIEIPEKVEGC